LQVCVDDTQQCGAGELVEPADLLVERPGGNQAAQRADACGPRADGIAQLGLLVDRCSDDCLGDGGRIVAVSLRSRRRTNSRTSPSFADAGAARI
jgi:hypothetical protein